MAPLTPHDLDSTRRYVVEQDEATGTPGIFDTWNSRYVGHATTKSAAKKLCEGLK